MLLLGKYESLGVLGAGSMGQVHACRPVLDPATTVVVKILKGNVTTPRGPASSSTARSPHTSRLRHPYIVRVLDHGFDSTPGRAWSSNSSPGTLRLSSRKNGG